MILQNFVAFSEYRNFKTFCCTFGFQLAKRKLQMYFFFPTSSQILPILPIFSIFFYFHQFSVIFFNLQQIFQPYKCSKCLLDLNVLIFSFFFQPLLKFLQFSLFFYFHQCLTIFSYFFNPKQVFQPYKCSKVLLAFGNLSFFHLFLILLCLYQLVFCFYVLN